MTTAAQSAGQRRSHLSVTFFYGGYLGLMYRTSSDFNGSPTIASSRGSSIFWRLCWSKSLGIGGSPDVLYWAHVLGVAINRHYVPVKVKSGLDVKRLKDLARISLPLSVPGYIHSSCLSATVSYVILKYASQTGLGIYGVALTFQGMGHDVYDCLEPDIHHKNDLSVR